MPIYIESRGGVHAPDCLSVEDDVNVLWRHSRSVAGWFSEIWREINVC